MASRNFRGSNAVKSSKLLFDEKKRYAKTAGASQVRNNPGLFRDFWFIENMYYGKIDREHNFIILKPEKLKAVADQSSNTIFLVDFAANALEDFLSNHAKAASMGKIQKNDEFLSDITLIKGHKNIHSEYDLHMDAIAKRNQRYIIRNHSKIENFDDFVDLYVERIIYAKEKLPITLTGLLSSRRSSLAITGLFTELSSLGYDKDSEKVNSFFDRPNFNFFMKNCLEHGFMIDYNVPWRMCVNIGSGEMEKYMLKYGTSPDNIFNDYYEPAYTKNMKYFMDYMLKYYNRFITMRPNIRRERSTGGANPTVHRYVEKRPQMTREILNSKYGSDYRINLFTDLRNYETNYRYDEAMINRIKDNAQEYLFVNEDVTPSYAYIEHQFKGFFNDLHAYNGVMMKREINENEEETTGQNLQKRLDSSVVESRDTLY